VTRQIDETDPSPLAGRIVVSSAAERLQTALDCLRRVHGLPQYAITTDVEMGRVTFVDDGSSEPIEGLGPIPPGWTVREVIERAADEARHAAQEALDEIAHAYGWPR
jgi:hypothetical protein